MSPSREESESVDSRRGVREAIRGAADSGRRVRRLLFVCSGNTCRSPMAEAIARAEAERRGLDVESRSAGTLGIRGQPASAMAAIVASERGLDLGGHRSSALGFRDLDWADLVLGMTAGHVEAARSLGGSGRVELLTHLLPAEHPDHGRDVSDPIGGARREYEEAFRLLEAAVDALFDLLAATEEAPEAGTGDAAGADPGPDGGKPGGT